MTQPKILAGVCGALTRVFCTLCQGVQSGQNNLYPSTHQKHLNRRDLKTSNENSCSGLNVQVSANVLTVWIDLRRKEEVSCLEI